MDCTCESLPLVIIIINLVTKTHMKGFTYLFFKLPHLKQLKGTSIILREKIKGKTKMMVLDQNIEST